MANPPRVLAIGGSDSGGSAGIQADLKTYEACGVFGTTALTLVTAQNTVGVQATHAIDPTFIEAQIDVVLSDIGADVIKTGLLARAAIVELVARKIEDYHAIPTVIDPVLVNGTGHVFVSPETIDAYRRVLLPRATVATPNLDEAALLSGIETITSFDDMRSAAQRIHGFGVDYVLIKGGHLVGQTIMDLLYDGTRFAIFSVERLPIVNPHGVGCTLASAIAAYLACGEDIDTAVQNAHDYLQDALKGSLGWQVGAGRLPVNHHFRL